MVCKTVTLLFNQFPERHGDEAAVCGAGLLRRDLSHRAGVVGSGHVIPFFIFLS